MDKRNIKSLITFISKTCRTTLTPKQAEQLREMQLLKDYDIRNFRKVYRIAIDNCVYPECPYCKQIIRTQEEFTVDHIMPRAKGGSDDIENLQPMHKTCNSDKGCMLPETTTRDDVPVKKCRHHKKHKRKEGTVVKGHSTEELYQKCKRIDQARIKSLANSKAK